MGLIFGILTCFTFVNICMSADTAGYYGLEDSADAAELREGESDISIAIGKIVGAGLAFIGVVFMILIIYGGILWMTARGNEQQVEKAKDLIYSAVIGLIIVLSAYAITNYVGGILGQPSAETASNSQPQ